MDTSPRTSTLKCPSGEETAQGTATSEEMSTEQGGCSKNSGTRVCERSSRASRRQEKVQIDRRSFLKGAAGLGAATLAVSLPLLSGCNSSENEEGSEEKAEDGGSFDIIVVGAGGAGMVAAITAKEQGAHVVLLEKMMAVGGNTHFAEGGMNASETAVQKREGVEDTNKLFAEDTYKGGHELGNIELIEFMCNNSNDAIERLGRWGMNLSKLGTSGGASVPRVHRPEDGSAVGSYLVEHLSTLCDEREVGALTNMDVKEILMEGGKVAGVKVKNDSKTIVYHAPAVILTTGGFGANFEKLSEYRPELQDAVTTNHPGAQGDGIEMGEAVGADTVDMKEIQVHPTVEQNTAILLSEGIRGDGAILVNSEGKRFVDELLTRDVVTQAEWDQPGGWAYAVFDQKVFDQNTSLETKFVANDLIIEADSLEELAAAMEVDPTAFLDTVKTYNDAIDQGLADPQGRTKSRYPIDEAPYYAVRVAPGIHHTMGGLRIDVDSHVINKEGKPIEGLYAAGEVSGGIHGGNRLGGNAMCDNNVYGYHCVISALKYVGIG